jgi:hypothetical protein
MREIYCLLPPLTYTKATLRTRVDGGDGDGLVFSVCASFCMFLQPPFDNWPVNGASHRQWLLLQTPTRKKKSNDWWGTAGCDFSVVNRNVQHRSK